MVTTSPRPNSAALYCRSSKDKAELGIDIQEKELREFAQAKGLAVSAVFADMEVSGSLDETSRPGLNKLLAAFRDDARGWDHLLVIDTSRIARDPMIGIYVTREAEKAGVGIQYAKMPVDGASAFGETMLSVIRAFDRLHARLSADKGRAGSEANVAKGFRAGGRAPYGYKLEHISTGAARGGVEVRKSRLVIDAAAARGVKAFLEGRAEGITRSEAARRAGLGGKSVASLVALEQNALTYAGFTVWNQRRKIKPTREDPRKTMERRPRAEWVVSKAPTHEALIAPEQAERIIALHEHRASKPVRVNRPEDFILVGLLFTPSGVQWHADGHDASYRAGKGKRINARWLEGEVLSRLAADFTDAAFLAKVADEARRMAAAIEADPKVIDLDVKRREKQLRNLVDLAAESGGRALLSKIREIETELEVLREQRATWIERQALKKQLLAITEDEIRVVLSANGVEIERGEKVLDLIGYEDHRLPPAELRRILTTLVERIELDPANRAFSIRYRLPVTGVKMASPRGFEPRLPP